MLASKGHGGGTYDLTGRESFTLGEAAELMSRLGGRQVRFEDETEEEAYASRAGFGAPDWKVRGWVTSYLAIRDGSFDGISTHVRELIGREPTSLSEYLKAQSEGN